MKTATITDDGLAAAQSTGKLEFNAISISDSEVRLLMNGVTVAYVPTQRTEGVVRVLSGVRGEMELTITKAYVQ